MKNLFPTILRQAEGAADVVPAAEPVAPPPAPEPSPSEAVTSEGGGLADPPPSDSDSRPPQGLLDRIGQLTRQKRELEERLQAMEAPQYAQQQYDVPAGQIDQRQIQMEIYRQAQELAKQNEWKSTTDKIWNEGLSKYGDWASQLNSMAQIGRAHV